MLERAQRPCSCAWQPRYVQSGGPAPLIQQAQGSALPKLSEVKSTGGRQVSRQQFGSTESGPHSKDVHEESASQYLS